LKITENNFHGNELQSEVDAERDLKQSTQKYDELLPGIDLLVGR